MESVVGKTVHRSRLQLVAAAALVVGGILWGVFEHEWFFLVFYVTFGGANLVLVHRPATVAAADGIRRPRRRPALVAWADVSSVLAPQPGVVGVRLLMTDGGQLALDDIPADRSADVAAVGGKDLVRTVVPRPPPPPPRPPRDADMLADVTRQAAALARQRQELAALSSRLKPS